MEISSALYSKRIYIEFSLIKKLIYQLQKHENKDRSSCPEVFCDKGVLRNFAKFAGKHLCQSLFFNKVAGLRPATLLKKRLRHMCFPLNFAKFRRTFFVAEHLQWLLLKFLRLSTWSNIALKKFLVLQLFHGFLASSHVGTS